MRVHRVHVLPTRAAPLLAKSLLLLVLQLAVTHAAHVFDAYRLVQFDKNGVPYGSRRTVINHQATALPTGLGLGGPELEKEIKNPHSPWLDQEPGSTPESNEDDDVEDDVDEDDAEFEEELKRRRKRRRKLSDYEDDEDDDDWDEDNEAERPSKKETTSDDESPKGKGKGKGPAQKGGKKKKKGSDAPKDLARKVVVLHIREINTEKLKLIQKRGATGVLILLDQDLEAVPEEELDTWRDFEKNLMASAWDIPIYFAFEHEEIEAMSKLLKTTSNADTVDRFQLVVSGPEAPPLPSVSVTNFQGWHYSAPSNEMEPEILPTIAVVANYDSFGSAPGLSYGMDSNGSGAVALLEIARIFSRLYSEFRTHGPYNLLFVLTGAGRLNFAGVKHWLRTVDSRVLDSLELALCLEAVGSSADELYLHVSKTPKTPEIRSLYNNFGNTAEHMGIPFEVVHRKVNVSSAHVNWQHEQFSRRRILAATLSSKKSPSPLFTSSSIFDRRNTVNSSKLARNIKFISESLAKQIYSHQDKELDVITESQAVNLHFVDAWLDYLGTQPRVTPYMDKKTDVVVQLEKVLRQHTTDSKAVTFTLASPYSFYGATSQKMSAYSVKPFTFDVFLALAIVTYLCLFHLYFKAPSSMKEFKTLFSKEETPNHNNRR